MFVQKFQVQNFKSFQDITIYFNKDVNVLTGKNNSGKTTIIEALSLWYECFTKLLTQANKSRSNYQQGDWILGIMEDVFSDSFPIGSQFKSIRVNYEDIFYECQSEKEISLGVTFCDGNNDLLEIKFNISKLDQDYKIVLNDYTNFDFKKFNSFLSLSPNPFSIYYSSPISTVSPVEIYRSLPEVEQACVEHKSGSVIRNRLYQISRFRVTLDLFQRDLAYILQNLIFFEFNFDNVIDDE